MMKKWTDTIEDEFHQIVKCPVQPKCPFVSKGYCTVYGYWLGTFVDRGYYFCPQYNWRYKKDVKFDEVRGRRMWYAHE